MITYTKLRSGEWGVRVTGPTPKIGSVVDVVRKDGTIRKETIRAHVWVGDGVCLCAIGNHSPAQPRNKQSSSVPKKRCWECGCLFTQEDARRYGGDWNNSYCGC